MTKTETGKIAVLWRGDHEARKSATPENNRFYRVFEELKALGIHAEWTIAKQVKDGPWSKIPACPGKRSV